MDYIPTEGTLSTNAAALDKDWAGRYTWENGEGGNEMKWLIASDIHGNAQWCGKLMEAFEKEKAERMLLLGDYLYNGMGQGNKQAVADMLNAHKEAIAAVRGNCDSDEDLAMLDFAVDEDYLVLPVGHVRLFATHGHKYDAIHRPPMDKGDILLQGHTHVPATRRYLSILHFNPGSVSLPKWGSERGYMTMEDSLFRWVTLEGEEYRRYEL